MNDPVSKPPAKMSSRERDELLKKGIQIAQPQAPVTVPQPQPEQPPQPQESQQSTQPIEALPPTPSSSSKGEKVDNSPQRDNFEDHDVVDNDQIPRGFVCEKCKWCDGFEPGNGDRQVCRVCKCELIFHIDVIEEEDDEDAEEFSSGEEDIWEPSGGMQESSSDQD